jgi:uncharacterized protein (TIRG00374 family)
VKTILIYLLKLLVVIAAIGSLLYFSDLKAINGALRQADYGWVAAGTVVFLVGQYLSSQRWRGILQAGLIIISRLAALRLNLIGTFSGNFLPGQGAGDIVKATLLFERFPDRKLFLLTSVAYDRLMGLIAILALSALAACLLVMRNGDWSAAYHVVWAAGLVLLLTLLATQLHRPKWLWRLLGERMGRMLAGFSETLLSLFRQRPLFLRTLGLSLLFQLSWVLALWLMLLAIQPGVPLLPVMLAAPLSVLIASIPITLGGLGVRESAFSLLMQQFGVSAGVATTAALLSLIPIIIFSAIGAFLFTKGTSPYNSNTGS